MTTRALVAVVLTIGSATPGLADTAHGGAGYCGKDYAEDLSSLSAKAREIEAKAQSYSYAVRTTATYECVSYGTDGNIRKIKESARAHGTAFGYRYDGGDTLLLTNTHVAEWPAVTDAEHPVEGVPIGCKKVSDTQTIVDDDRDRYAADDIPLQRVVSDPALDVAILRAKQKLAIIPWKVGKSANLSPRNVVESKGFPLGEFQATNIGKVISTYDHDEQGEWNHDDFVIDALLSSGGSGSPVLAVSCKTGEFELVGIFHAHYSAGSALNVVVGIDQVRELMSSLKRSPKQATVALLDQAARSRIVAATKSDDPPFFAFGSLVASVKARDDGTLVWAVYPSEFPRTTRPVMVIEDHLDVSAPFGVLGNVYVGSTKGLQAFGLADADPETQLTISKTLDLLRRDALSMFDYRAASTASGTTTRQQFQQNEKTRRALSRSLDGQRDASQLVVDLAAKTPLRAADPVVGLAQIETTSVSSN